VLFETNQTLSILSTIPPEPLTGLSYQIGAEELSIENLKDNGLNLLDLVRVPQINESHILQIVDLPEGVQIEVGSEILPTAFLRTHPDENDMPVVQLTSEQLQTAVVRFSEDINGELFDLNFQARVGTSDGLSSNEVDTRYVYSRLVEFDANLFNKATDGNDVLVASNVEISSGSGDDKIFVADGNISDISGGDGNDSISFNQLDSQNNILIDLNMGKLIVADELNVSSIENANNISGIENIIGSQGNDTIVANENSTERMTLRGNGGDDYLVGSFGNDFLEGGEGDDLLAGSLGTNTFIFSPNQGTDTILDLKQGDIIQLNGYGITQTSGGVLPPEVTILEVPNNQNDWQILIAKSISGVEKSTTIVLSDLKNQYANHSQIEALLLSSIVFSEDLNMDTTDMLESSFELSAPVTDIINDLPFDRDNFFGSEFNFDDVTDDISNALGVIADAKYQEALIVTDRVSDFNNLTGFKEALLDENTEFKGLSGSKLDDVLVAEDSDSVLFGGDGGADRLIGGSGDDILIASKSEDNSVDNLAGGAGSDLFTLINPQEIDENLNSIYQVKIEDFNREEGDRVVLLGYQDGNEIELSEVDAQTNTQSATISHNNVDNLTIHFDLSFAREFDSNFSLRMADFDKFESV
jgi:Ca2+-binding RTX toxin-like protein